MASPDVTRTVEAVWRIESARLVAGVARLVRDIGLAEDLAQEALVAALEQWPESGVPDPMPGSEAIIEIRPIFEAEDFGEEFTPELREKEERLRAQVESSR